MIVLWARQKAFSERGVCDAPMPPSRARAEGTSITPNQGPHTPATVLPNSTSATQVTAPGPLTDEDLLQVIHPLQGRSAKERTANTCVPQLPILIMKTLTQDQGREGQGGMEEE